MLSLVIKTISHLNSVVSFVQLFSVVSK